MKIWLGHRRLLFHKIVWVYVYSTVFLNEWPQTGERGFRMRTLTQSNLAKSEQEDIMDGVSTTATSSRKMEKRREQLLDAIHVLARRSPEMFELEAEDFIRRAMWSERGRDPSFANTLERWLHSEFQFETFATVLPPDAKLERRHIPNPDLSEFREVDKAVFAALQSKFDGTEDEPFNHHRWDAATRDQFIVLGMIAMGGKRGERQSRIVHYLGLGTPGPDDLRGSNTVRAAKIAITRFLRARVPEATDLFASATGNGGQRLHRIRDTDVARMLARYALNHPASLLLPDLPIMAEPL